MILRAAITAALLFTAGACTFVGLREGNRLDTDANDFVMFSQLGIAIVAIIGIFAMVLL